MRKKYLPLLLILVLLSTVVVAQDSGSEKLMEKANLAFSNGDYQAAGKQYEAVVQRDSTYSDAWYNLAVTRVYQNKLDDACRSFYKAYSLGAFDAAVHIKEYCGTVISGEIMHADEVDEMPKFKYFWDYEPLIMEDKTINPHFVDLLRVEMKRSFRGYEGVVYLIWSVDIHGNLVGKVRMGNEDWEKEFMKLLQNLTTYKAATYKGRPVGLWTFYKLPITIKEKDKRKVWEQTPLSF